MGMRVTRPISWEWNGSGNKSTGIGIELWNRNEFPLQLFNVSYEILFSNT